ncbi:MAG: hypothetical protein Kow0062_13830 [Acidobacteriota bacterium]
MSSYQPVSFSRRPEVPTLRDEPPRREREVMLGMGEVSLLLLIIGAVSVGYALPFTAVKYGLIAFFGVLFVVKTLQRPAMGLALLAFGIPAIDLIPKGLIPIRAVNAETLMIVALLFVIARANAISGREPLRTKMGFVLAIYAVLIIVSCVNGWFTWQRSLFDLLSAAKNHLAYMLFLPAAFHVVRERRDKLLVVSACVLSLFLNCLQAIDESWLAFATGTLERHRASALLALQPNLFGAALAMYLPVTMLFASKPIGSRWVRLVMIAVNGAIGFALILTLSRGAWLGAVAGLLVLALLADRKLLILFALAAAGYQYWVPDAAISRVEETKNIQGELGANSVADDSTQMRVEQYKSLPAMMKPRPILGWGYRSYPRVFEKYGTLKRSKGAHSTYVLIGTEEGVIGWIVLAFVFGSMIFIGWKSWRLAEDPLDRYLGIGVLVGAVSMLVSMMAGSRFEAQKMWVFYWVFFGIAERGLRLAELRGATLRRPALSVVGGRDGEPR